MRIRTPPGRWILEFAIALLFPVVASFFLAACGRSPAPPGDLSIEPVTSKDPAPAIIRINGLGGDELSALSSGGLDEAAWQRFFVVNVAGGPATPMAGRYAVSDGAPVFIPAFQFDPGRKYLVRFDPAAMPRPRQAAAISSEVTFGSLPETRPAVVTSIYPSGGVWPENMLRFYITFSAPMSRGHRTDFVHLLDEGGHEVPDAVLAAYSDLWNQDSTRLTVFFDPGRVKRGIGPNVKMGRALVAGRRYAIRIDAEWPDVNGRPLASPFSRSFLAGPAVYGALSVADWQISSPRAATSDLLAVHFPAPLDHALIERAIGVRTAAGAAVAGNTSAGPEERSWTFAPARPWSSGNYQLVVLTLLEDPEGNKIGRAFEVLTDSAAANQTEPETVARPFRVD
jgi:hypothetical protein